MLGGVPLKIGGTFTMTFTTPNAIYGYLPAGGNPAALNQNLTDTQSSSSGEFGGEVLALQLNVDFSSVLGNAVSLGNVRICKFAAVPSLNGQTVDQFLTTANWVLGGGSSSLGLNTISAVANLLNTAFADGKPTTFAQSNLVAGNCPQ